MRRNSSNRQNAPMETMFRARWVSCRYPLSALRTLSVSTTLMLSVTRVTSMARQDRLGVNHLLIKIQSCGLRWTMTLHLSLCKSLISIVALPFSRLKFPSMTSKQRLSHKMRSSGLMCAKVTPWQQNCA